MYAAASGVIPVRAAVLAVPPGAACPRAPGVAVFEAGHPAPNAASVSAGEGALAIARAAGASGLTILLSGGASAMLSAPVEGVTLAEKTEASRALMAAGAAIHELNCVRKHLSRIKGGGLAKGAHHTVTLALSDVHGPVPDDPAVIGSGPTVADATTFAEALAIVRRLGAPVPPAVAAYLERGARGEVPETLKPGDPKAAASFYRVIGNRQTAMEGARAVAQESGYAVLVLPPATSGEARDAGAEFVRQAVDRASSVARPACVLASGETTVRVRGRGTGGRNQEFVLGAAAELRRRYPGDAGSTAAVAVASVGTDGIDGPTDAAGAIADPGTLARAAQLGLDADAALAGNDAYPFFQRLGELVMWGPTGTNVGDLHVLLMA